MQTRFVAFVSTLKHKTSFIYVFLNTSGIEDFIKSKLKKDSTVQLLMRENTGPGIQYHSCFFSILCERCQSQSTFKMVCLESYEPYLYRVNLNLYIKITSEAMNVCYRI